MLQIDKKPFVYKWVNRISCCRITKRVSFAYGSLYDTTLQNGKETFICKRLTIVSGVAESKEAYWSLRDIML